MPESYIPYSDLLIWFLCGFIGAILMWLAIVISNITMGLATWRNYWPPQPMHYVIMAAVMVTGGYAMILGVPIILIAIIYRYAQYRRLRHATIERTTT